MSARHGTTCPRFLILHPATLRAIREARGLSVAQLAAIVGVSTVAVRDWEHGRHGGDRGMGTARAARLLRALRQDPRYPEAIGQYTHPDASGGIAHDPAIRHDQQQQRLRPSRRAHAG